MEAQVQNDDVVNKPKKNEGEMILSLEGVVKEHITALEIRKEDLKKNNDMLQDIFINDSIYAAHDAAAKDAIKIRKQTRQEILKRPDVAELNARVKELRQSKKDVQLSLFDYANEYMRVSGVDEVESDDGKFYIIIPTAKVVKGFRK